MIVTEKKNGSLKEIRRREASEKEAELRRQCEAVAIEKLGLTKEKLATLSNEHKGLWYLPILDEEGGTIEKLGVMKPITRAALSYASTKIQDEGLYEFLEAAMRECWLAGDSEIMDDDQYFIPAANQFNKILEGKKAALLKR